MIAMFLIVETVSKTSNLDGPGPERASLSLIGALSPVTLSHPAAGACLA